MGQSQPSQVYDPNLYPGHDENRESQYLQELRYRPQVRQTQSLPNRLPLEYGFVEQHEGTFSFEDHKRKPHQRSRLKELHTDSLKLQKRRQKLKLADMGVQGDSVIPEVQSPTSSQTDSKPGTPDDGTPVAVPVVGFENPNFDYAAAENNRRYREQQMKQKLLQRQEQMMHYAEKQQQQQQQKAVIQQLQQQQQQQQQQQNQQQQSAQKSKQGEVFVNNYALNYEQSKHKNRNECGGSQQRFFDDVKQQQQYWKHQEQRMLHKEQLKYQELYRRQQEQLYRKQQEKMYRQQQKQRKAEEQQYRNQLDKEPQRYNNLDKQPSREQVIRQHQEQLRQAGFVQMQNVEQMRLHQYALQQQQQHQQQTQQTIPFHAPETPDDYVEDYHIHHHHHHHEEHDTTSEKNIQVDNLPTEYLHHKPRHKESGKQGREHNYREKHGRKRHKRHKTDHSGNVHTEKTKPVVTDEKREEELFISEPTCISEIGAKESNIVQEESELENTSKHAEPEDLFRETEEEEKRMEKLRREHKQNTTYFKERNTTEEQSFARYATSRMMYDRCVKEMKGLHSSESIDFVQDQTRIVSKLRRDSSRSDGSSTAPARSETSEASTSDLQQTKGGTFFAHVQHRGSVDSAEPVDSPPGCRQFGSLDSTVHSTGSQSPGSLELFPANIKYDAENKQHILSISAEGGMSDDASPPATFEEIDDSLHKYMEWLHTEEVRQKQLSSGTRSAVVKEGEEKVSETVSEQETEVETKTNVALHIEEEMASKRISYLEPQEDVVEVEKWDSNGTTYSVYLVTKKLNEDDESDGDLDINSEVIAMLDHSMESEEQLDAEILEVEEKHVSSSNSDIPTIKEPTGKESDVRFYISSSNEFLEESETRSTGSYKISEEELLDLEYRVPTILDENEKSLLQSDGAKENPGAFLQVPPSAMNIKSSDGDDGDMHIDESAEEKELEKIMSAEETYDSTSEEEFSRNHSFDIEEEVDDILENIEVETYSPTSTLSKAFSHPKKKKKPPRMLRHVQPPEMVPITSAESNSEMTSSTSSNQEMLHSLDIQTTQYQHLANEYSSADDDADNMENECDSKDNKDLTQGSEKCIEGDTEEDEAVIPGTSPEDAFEVVVEAASEEGYGSDWPSDHDEFLPRVIKGKGKKSTDMFIYDFYHEKWSQKRTSSCECLADGASVGRISDIGSDDLERSVVDDVPEGEENKNLEKSTQDELLSVPRAADRLMKSSMTSSNISDASSLEQIIDDTMQLTERILSSCEKIEAQKENNVELQKPEESLDLDDKNKDETVEIKQCEKEESEDKKTIYRERQLSVKRQDSEITELEKDSRDVEEISKWTEKTVGKHHENHKDSTEEITMVADSEPSVDVTDETADKPERISDDRDTRPMTMTIDIDTAVASEEPQEKTKKWSQDTVRKSSVDSLDTAEIIHVIDDIPEDDIYDINEEKISSDSASERPDKKQKSLLRCQSPNLSDTEVVIDTHVEVVEENFYRSSVDKLEEETRCLTTRSIDHKDMFMESESKVCTYGEPIYTNRQALLPRSPLVTKVKDPCSEDEHFVAVSGSDFDTKSFEELERLIALEESGYKDNTTSEYIAASVQKEPPLSKSLAKVVVKEVETLESAALSKVTTNEHTIYKTNANVDRLRDSSHITNVPQKLKTMALTVVKSCSRPKRKHEETHDGRATSTNHDGVLSKENEGNRTKDTVGIAARQNKTDVSRHPLVVRRQQGLLNRDIEFESVTSDVVSDTSEPVVYNSTPSGSLVYESDSSSISLADKPKMDFLKPGTNVNNDDSSISDLFPETDSEPLDDDVFLSDSCYPEPENAQASWSELVTDTSSNVASFEARNLLSDTQAENFLRHMLGIHEQSCHSDASDSEQAELQEDLSACLSDVCQVVTSESESEAGEVLSEEVHSQEVTLVFAWPKDKSQLPSPSRKHAGKPYREIHVRKVTRVKDFDVEILEGPKIMYTKKKAIEDTDSRLQDNPEITVSKPEDDSEKLDVICESGIFRNQSDDTRQEILSDTDNLNLDDLLQNLSDISSELDITGEKSVQMHDGNEAWNIHAIPLVVPRTVGTPGSPSSVVPSETGMKEAIGHGGDDGDGAALVENRKGVHAPDVEHDHFSDQAITHEDLTQHGGERSEVDSTAVANDHKTVNAKKDDEHEHISSKSNTDTKHIESEHDNLKHTGDRKTHGRRTIIVTAVLRPKSELERQFDRPKDVCQVKHCDTCKSLVHVRKVAKKRKSVRSHLKCMKCNQMISERLVSRVTKTSSCKNISESSSMVYSTNTWPPLRNRTVRHDAQDTDISTEQHFKKLSGQFRQTVTHNYTNNKTDTTKNTQVEEIDQKSNSETNTQFVTNKSTYDSGQRVEPTSEYTPLLSEAQLYEIKEQLNESHLSIESIESDTTNPFDETSSSTDTVVGLTESTNIVTFQNPHPHPQGLRSPPPRVEVGSQSKTDVTRSNGRSLHKEESLVSDNLDVITEGYASDTEELLSEIEYELNLQVPVSVLSDKVEDSSCYIHLIPETPRAEGLQCNVDRSGEQVLDRIAAFLPQKVIYLLAQDNSTYLSPIKHIVITDSTKSRVVNEMIKSPKVSQPDVKHRSARFDTRELVCSVESTRLTFEPYEEEIDLPEDVDIIYPTVTTKAILPVNSGKELQKCPPNGFTDTNVCAYADIVAGNILQDTLKQLALLYPTKKKKKKTSLKYAVEIEVGPTELQYIETSENVPDSPEQYSMFPTHFVSIQLEMITSCPEDPILTITDNNPGTECTSQFLYESNQYTSVIGVECIEGGVVTNSIPKPTDATTKWHKTAGLLELPSPMVQILILQDHFMSEHQVLEAEVTYDPPLLLSKANVKIDTVDALFLSEPADSGDHKRRTDENECKENDKDFKEGKYVVDRQESIERKSEIEFKAKAAAIKEAIQAVHGSKEKLNQPASENKNIRGSTLVNTCSHKSMHIKQMESGLVENAFHEAINVMFHEQPNSKTNSIEKQPEIEQDENDTNPESSYPRKENIEWRTNQKETEENKIWKGNPFVENDENKVWKGNPIHDEEPGDRVIPILQRRTSTPVHQSDIITPRETANNVSIVEIGEVRTAGSDDRALKSDAIAGARLVWKDYRGRNRYYTEHNVPDYQEAMDKVIRPRISQSTPELHREEFDETMERIKEDIITIDAKGSFVLPARKKLDQHEAIEEVPKEPKKKKELSIRIPVQVTKEPTYTEKETIADMTRSQQVESEQGTVAKFKQSEDAKLPDLLGEAPAFTPYGGVRTYLFGKDDVDKDVHHHEERSRDGEHLKKSKLTTTTQHSGKHSECTFSTEGTISDIPVFGALFGGIQDGSRPGPDHKSIQSAFDNLFGSTGQPDCTRLKEIDGDSNLDWHKMQEERANIEKVTFTDDEANKETVKTLDLKVERSEETIGDVPADLGIISASKPIHDVSTQIARKDLGKSRRAVTYNKPALPPHPTQPVSVESLSPKGRRRREVLSPKSLKSPKSPRRRRRLVCPEHQRTFQEIYEGYQDEMKPRIEIVRDTPSSIEPPPRRYITREDTNIETGVERQSSTPKLIPQELVGSFTIPVQHEQVTTVEYKEISIPVTMPEARRERHRTEEIPEKQRLAAVASDEDNEVRNIMEKSPGRDTKVVSEEMTTRRRTKRTVETREKRKKKTDSKTIISEVKVKSEVPDDISSTKYVFPIENKLDIVEHPKPGIHMTCDENVVDSEGEDYAREMPENQRSAIEVSKKYYKAEASACASDMEAADEEIPERQVFYDDVAGARLILKDKFGPSAFEVVRPQPSRRLVASSHDISRHESNKDKSLSTSTPSVYKGNEFMSETKTRQEDRSFFEGMSKTINNNESPTEIPLPSPMHLLSGPPYNKIRDLEAARKFEDKSYKQEQTDLYEMKKSTADSCQIKVSKDNFIKVDRKGRFVLPAAMISNVSKVKAATTTTTTTMNQLPVVKTSTSASSPVLHDKRHYKISSDYQERRKSSSPVGFLKPSDIYDRDAEVLHHGMSVSPSSPSFYRRTNQITVRKSDEDTTKRKENLLKPTDIFGQDTERSLSTSSPSLYNTKDDSSVGIFGRKGARGLIKPSEIMQMEERMGVRKVTSSSEGHLSIPIRQIDQDHKEMTQSCKELGSIQTGPTGISFLDAMFAHRSVDSSASTLTEQCTGKYHDIDTSDDDQMTPVHGYSRSLDTVTSQERRQQPDSSSTQTRPMAISSFVAESEPNINGWRQPYSPRRRKPIEYVVQKQFLDDTVPYILGSDVVREQESADEDEPVGPTTFTDTQKSYQSCQQHFGETDQSNRIPTSRKKPIEYVLHCRSFYDSNPFISSEDVSLNVNATDKTKMKKNFKVIKKKLPLVENTLCDGNDDTNQIDERHGTLSRKRQEQNKYYREENEKQAIYVRKLTKDDAYQYFLPERSEKPVKLSQSEQHLPFERKQMHHELDKEIRDLIGLSLPSLNQLLHKQRIVKCKVDTVDVPEDRARIISFSGVRRKKSSTDYEMKRYTKSSRSKPVTEYIIQRDDVPSAGNGLRREDIIQKRATKYEQNKVQQISRHVPDTSNKLSIKREANFTERSFLNQSTEPYLSSRPRQPFHTKNYEKWNRDMTAMSSNTLAAKQCPPPSDQEHRTQFPAKCEVQFPVLASPPVRRKEINVRVNDPRLGTSTFTIPNSQEDVSRAIQYEQELNYSDEDEENKSEKSKTVVTSTGSTGTGSDPYPGVLPRTYFGGSSIGISENSSDTSEQDWDSFFRSLDAQNAQLYEAEGSNSDVSEDLDMILYSGYMNKDLVPLSSKQNGQAIKFQTESAEMRRQSLTRQGAVDHSSPVSGVEQFSFDAKFPGTSMSDNLDDSFEKLFKKVEAEEYDNVPSTHDREEYDNVPSIQVKHLQTSSNREDTVKESRDMWNLRALLAGQDRPGLSLVESTHSRRGVGSRYAETVSVPSSRIGSENWQNRQLKESPEVLPDQEKQIERLNLIRGNVESLLAEVERLQSAIRVSQEKRASSVVSDLPSYRRNQGSMEELRSIRAKSLESNYYDRNATEQLLQDIAAKVKKADVPSTCQIQSSRQDSMGSIPSSDLSSESDTQDSTREKTPKSILKVKTEKQAAHVRFSEDQVNNNKKQPQKPKRKQVSTMAAKTSPAGRSPPMVRRIILDNREIQL